MVGSSSIPPPRESKLLTARDIGSEFTDGTFTPSTETTDPCGQPNARSVVPPTKEVGSEASDASQNLVFQEDVVFHKSAADNRKAFDVGVNSLRSCTSGTIPNSDGTTSPFSVSGIKDVSAAVGVSKAIQFTVTSGDVSVEEIAARLDNCIAAFVFQFPTSAGESAQPDAISIAKDGLQQLLG